jgi:adenylate kinase family enzyme
MSRRLIIFGNSGSGKSTLAGALARREGLAHLDLDTLAWRPATPPERRPVDDSKSDIAAFITGAEAWVIEGCYGDLLAFAAGQATGAIWLDLPVEACTANARARPFEPHKYVSPEAQDANLPMLIDWIRAYDTRSDTFSRRAHQMLFDSFASSKVTLRANSAVEDIPFLD